MNFKFRRTRDGKEKEANEEKDAKLPKQEHLLPLPRVNSPQKLSRKNFDKHKISKALLKVIILSISLPN